MPSLQEFSGKYHLTIPPSIVKAKKWKKGQELLLILNNKGNIELLEQLMEG